MINSNTQRFIRRSKVFIQIIQLENFLVDNQSSEYILVDIKFQNEIPDITIELDLSKNLTARRSSNQVDDANYIIDHSEELQYIDFGEGLTSELIRLTGNILNCEKSTLSIKMIFNQEKEVKRELEFDELNSRLNFI